MIMFSNIIWDQYTTFFMLGLGGTRFELNVA